MQKKTNILTQIVAISSILFMLGCETTTSIQTETEEIISNEATLQTPMNVVTYDGILTEEQIDSIENADIAVLAEEHSRGNWPYPYFWNIAPSSNIPYDVAGIKILRVYVTTDDVKNAGTDDHLGFTLYTTCDTLGFRLDVGGRDDNNRGTTLRFDYWYMPSKYYDKVKKLDIMVFGTDGWRGDYIRTYEYNRNYQNRRYLFWPINTWIDGHSDKYDMGITLHSTTSYYSQDYLYYNK